MIEIIFGTIVVVGVLLYFQHALKVRDQRLPQEEGRTPVYEEHCGARIERGRNFTVPFVRVSVYDGFVAIACLDYRRAVTTHDIATFEVKRSIFGAGLRVQHRDTGIPVVTLWPLNLTQLERAIVTHVVGIAPPD